METDTNREHHVKMKAEVGVLHLQERQRLPATTEVRRQAWNVFSLTATRKNQPCRHFILDFQSSELYSNTFLLFNPPSLWSFATAASGNKFRQRQMP